MPYFCTKSGYFTGCILGFINSLQKITETYKSSYGLVIFDNKGKNFRHVMYSKYKYNRKSLFIDINNQIQDLYFIIKSLGFAVINIPNIETDDIIGSICNISYKKNFYNIIASNDKDFIQLINKKVFVYNEIKDCLLNINKVKEFYKIKPNQLIDYLSVIGDKVDNITGIEGIGEKNALFFLKTYRSINKILKQKINIDSKFKFLLNLGKKKIIFYKKIIAIKSNLGLPFSIYDIKLTKANAYILSVIFSYLDFKSILANNIFFNNYRKTKLIATVARKKTLRIIIKKIYIDKYVLMQFFCKKKVIQNILEKNILGIMIFINAQRKIFLPLVYINSFKKNFFKKSYFSLFKNIINCNKINKISYSIKCDLKVLAHYGIKYAGKTIDLSILNYLHNPNLIHSNFENIISLYIREKDFFYLGNTKNIYKLEQLIEYKTDILVYTYFTAKLSNSLLLKKYYELIVYVNIEIPMLLQIISLESAGFLNNKKTLIKNDKKNNKLKILLEIYIKLLYLDKLKKKKFIYFHEYIKYKKKIYKTKHIFQIYKRINKINNNYIKGLLNSINLVTEKVHTYFKKEKTITSRLSSINPNIQNIPVKMLEGNKVRESFLSKKYYKFLTLDFAQIELRTLTNACKDLNFISAFDKKIDIHIFTASQIFNLNILTINNQQRIYGKIINYSVVYGMTPFILSKSFGLSYIKSIKFFSSFFKKNPALKSYIKKVIRYAYKYGYIYTIFGRKIFLPYSENNLDKKDFERFVMNASIQSCSSDIIKKYMIKISNLINQNNMNKEIEMIIQVHDEIIFEIYDKGLSFYSEILKNSIIRFNMLDINMDINIKISDNWIKK